MKYLIVLILFVLKLSALDKGTIIETKKVNNEDISLVKVEAAITPNKADNSDNKKRLYFFNLDKKLVKSKNSFEKIPNSDEFSDRTTIYYFENEKDKERNNDRGIYLVFLF